MPIIPLGDWLPGLPPIQGPHLRDARGCLPRLQDYEPFRGLTATTDALGARCIGAIATRDIDQAAHLYAADSTDIYELEGSTFTNRSQSVGGYGPAGDSTRWRFATFGDRLVAVNGIDAPQYIDMSTAATAFADLPDSPPSAQFVATFGEFLVLGALGTSGLAIKWSGIGDSENWTAGTDQSDEQEFPDGGRVTGLGATDQLFIFQEKAIRRMNYIGGATIMQIDKIVEGIGCVEPQSLVQFGRLFFFLSEDGFYQFDGENLTPIGVGKIDGWFRDNAPRGYWAQMSAAINPNRKLVAWAFCKDSVSVPDAILFFHYAAGRWTWAPYTTELLMGAMSLGVTLDSITSPDVDSITISFDDPFWLGGTFYFAGFSADHRLGSFAGDTVEATFETGDAPLMDGVRASVEWMRPVADTTAALMAGAARQRHGDAVTFQDAVAQRDSGRCPMRGVNGVYVRAKLTIPAGEAWTTAQGLELMARRAGVR